MKNYLSERNIRHPRANRVQSQGGAYDNSASLLPKRLKLLRQDERVAFDLGSPTNQKPHEAARGFTASPKESFGNKSGISDLSPHFSAFSRSLRLVASEYLRYRALHQGSSAGSCEQYERTYVSFLSSLAQDTPRAFTADAVHAWCMAELERGVGPRTVNSRLAHLTAFGSYLVKHKQLTVNPARAVERPRFQKREAKFLHPEELKAFLGISRPAHEDIARVLFLDTMLRVSEVANASLGDLESVGDRAQLRVVVKGGAEKRVPLSPAVAEQLRGYLESRGELSVTAPLIANSRGQRWTRTGLSQLMARIATDAGITRIKVSSHKLRHTAATVALASGVNPLAVSKLLNHSNLQTTTQYLHLAPGALDQARDQQRAGLLKYLG